MGWRELDFCAPLTDPLEGPSRWEGAGVLPSEVVRLPVQAILYLQPMAEIRQPGQGGCCREAAEQ